MTCNDCFNCEYKNDCDCYELIADSKYCIRFKPEKTKQTALNVQQGCESFD